MTHPVLVTLLQVSEHSALLRTREPGQCHVRHVTQQCDQSHCWPHHPSRDHTHMSLSIVITVDITPVISLFITITSDVYMLHCFTDVDAVVAVVVARCADVLWLRSVVVLPGGALLLSSHHHNHSHTAAVDSVVAPLQQHWLLWCDDHCLGIYPGGSVFRGSNSSWSTQILDIIQGGKGELRRWHKWIFNSDRQWYLTFSWEFKYVQCWCWKSKRKNPLNRNLNDNCVDQVLTWWLQL